MADSVLAFGRPTSEAAANAAANSPTLNANPSPPVLQSVPDDQEALLRSYRQLLYAGWRIRKLEHDPDRLAQMERCVAFAMTAVQQLEDAQRTAGPPVPTLTPPPPPMPAGGFPPQNPGGAQVPQAPGAPAA